ncbi:MAG TPA: helix-turn-helix domain-containing protein, partial [Pseudonocardia sp.]|nr:helix-turn-helix domain-containing protein [Pseudonocardia sp.]
MTGPIELDGLSLRERKKVLTKRSILDAAKRLFEERGYDEVTVAEIADAANVSVKTLFVYFRSKEDLVFADNDLIDTLLARLTSREEHISPARVVADVLIEEVRGQPDGAAGLRAYHHAYGDSTALRSRLLRMWSEWEDRVTELLAGQAGAPANPIT